MAEIFDRIKVGFQNYISKLDDTNNANSAIIINLNGNQAEMEGNVDSFRNTQKNNPNKYELIKEILNEYRINLTEAEQYGLLEAIAGCTKNELQKMSEEEFNKVVEALKDALGITGHWKLPWENRNLEDIKKIANDANNRYLSQKTGGNWLQQKWFDLTTKSELIKELQSEGNSINNESELDTAIKTYVQNNYFKGLTPEELKNKYSVDEINNFYEKALRGFGNLLIKYNSPEDKTIITSVIEMLRADQRNLAVDVAFNSCQNNIETKEIVAVSIDNKALYIAGKKDAFGEQMTQEENIELRTTVYDNMNKKENREASYSRIKEVAEEYQELIKKEQEGTLTDSEKARLAELKELNAETLYVVGGYSAARISASKRVENGEPDIITELVNLEKDAADLGYQEEVIEAVASYVKNNQEAINMTEEDFKKLMNEVTDGNSNQILNNTTSNTESNTSVINNNLDINTSTSQDSIEIKSNTNNNSHTENCYTNLGYSVTTINQENKPEEIKKNLYNQQKDTIVNNEENNTNETLIKAARHGYKSIINYIKKSNDSTIEVATNLLKLNQSKECNRIALTFLEPLDDRLKANICNWLPGETKILLAQTIKSPEALEKVESNNNKYSKDLEKLKEELLGNSCNNPQLV